MTFSNTGVLSIDGGTGAITNVARTNVNNQFSDSQNITGFLSVSGTIYSYDSGVDRTISLNPSTDKITFRDEGPENQIDLYVGGNYNNQVIAFPQSNTTLAGLAVSQTFTATNTFSSVTNFLSGISAAGGVTLSGNFSGATGTFTRTLTGTTANFTGLVSSTVGFSGSGTNLTNIVKTFNGLSGGVTLAAGTNITLTPVGNTITIASSGGGGGGSSVYGVTASLDFSENINKVSFTLTGLGNDISTSLAVFAKPRTEITTLLVQAGVTSYYPYKYTYETRYNTTTGEWFTNFIIKQPFPLTDTGTTSAATAEQIVTTGISSVTIDYSYYDEATNGVYTSSDFWSGSGLTGTYVYHQEETYVTKTLTGITWVTDSMFLNCKVLGLTSSDHTAEDAILEGVNFEINNIVGGTGFDIIGHAPEGTYGKYTIKCLGQ